MSFIHLHVHSQYSFLDGASSLDTLLKKASTLNMPALAITDHNRLTGAIRFYDKARALGIKPIIGAEIDMDGGYHLTLLCKNLKGYSNLCQLITQAHLSNPQGKPQATKKMLLEHSKGLIALSGCGKGEIPSLLNLGKTKDAQKAARHYREIFGDDFFIELMRHRSREGGSGVKRLAAFAEEVSIPIIASNNVHYADVEGYAVKELLNSIGANMPSHALSGPRTVEQYLKSQKEMEALFRDHPQAIRATGEVAARCNLEMDLGTPRFPKFDIPKGETDYSYLCKLAYSALPEKYPTITNPIRQRLKYEIDTINKLGFCSYFLAVWDIVKWAKRRGIRCQARGSAVDRTPFHTIYYSSVSCTHCAKNHRI